MKAVLTINMDGAAFGDENYESIIELQRILEKLAVDIDEKGISRPGDFATVFDVNGNSVGRFEIQS